MIEQDAELIPEAELIPLIPEETLKFDIQKTACFTGHRPGRFPFDQTDTVRTNMIKSMLCLKVCQAVDAGYTAFITGMARGVDTWCALTVLSLKEDNPAIRLIGVSPFRKETNRLFGSDLKHYSTIADNADEMIYLSEEYHNGCYQVRNRYMVDHSSLVIGAVFDMRSGTGSTIRYAERRGVKTDIININSLGDILKL